MAISFQHYYAEHRRAALALVGFFCLALAVFSCSKRGHENPFDPAGSEESGESSFTPTDTFTHTPPSGATDTSTFTVTNTSTHTPTNTHTPLPSPTPDRPVVYVTDAGGMKEIYKMNLDGSNQTQLTVSGGWHDDFPAWAPDGSERIVFQTEQYYATGHKEISVMNGDGTGITRLTNTASNVIDEDPDWSPDGSQICFASDRDSSYVPGICVMNDDGTGQTMITDTAGSDIQPCWSPDGQWIAFTSTRAGAKEIYKVKPDGSSLTQLTSFVKYSEYPSWSPDGSKIIFASTYNGANPTDYNIYTMNPDGSGLSAMMTIDDMRDQAPRYSSDGSFIFWYSDRDTDFEIMRMKSDLSGKIKITNNSTNEYSPDYRW